MVRCFGCLFRWAAADDTIVWSAVLSTDHPAGSSSNNDQQGKQETGNRMKKAGYPVHLDQRVKHDITKASLFNKEYLIGGQNVCRFAWLTTTHTYIFLSILFTLPHFSCVSVFSLRLSSPSYWHCFADCSIIHDIKSYPLQCEKKGEREKQQASLFEYTHISDSLTKPRQKKEKKKEFEHEQSHKHKTWNLNMSKHSHTPPRCTTDRQTRREPANTEHRTARSRFYAEIFYNVFYNTIKHQRLIYSAVIFNTQVNIPHTPPLQQTEKVAERHC